MGSMTKAWSSQGVADRLWEAARTAHRLPPVTVQGYFSLWPVIARSEYERMACDEPRPVRFEPTPQEVDRMLQAMRWVQVLELNERHLVWMRANRHDWQEIGKRFACDRTTAWRRWRRDMNVLVTKLNAGEID
jgi:hypothetical protein